MHTKFWLGRPFETTKRRWDDDNIMNLREIGWEGVDWMHLARIGTSGVILIFCFHKMRGIS
jgi:membrane glycosyltransferase